MKENTVNIRTSEEDKENLQKAAENLSILTDEKPSLSKAIREGVKLLAEQDPTKPELFYVNRRALRDLEVNLEYGKQHLQLIYDEYLRATGNPPTMEEIQSWFGSAKSNFLVANAALIRESIVQKESVKHRAEVPWLQFDPDKIILPDLDKLLEVCSQLIFIPEIEYREKMFWQCYEIAKDKIELIPEAIEAVKNQYRIYAITPEEKARLAGIRKLCILMDTIRLSNPAMLNIPGFCSYDNEAGVFTPMENYIKGYIK
jgi:hypothetical protein